MPRLFTGLEIPAAHRAALSLLQHGQPKGARDVIRWTDPADFHLTLRFIGNVTPRVADDIVEALAGRRWRMPLIELAELKSFGGDKPTSVFASVKPDESLSVLAAGQERLMRALGLSADPRRFTPHVTIARCRGATSEQIARYLSLHGGYFKPRPFHPARFVLYSAREPQGGGPYQVEEVFDLSRTEDAEYNAWSVPI